VGLQALGLAKVMIFCSTGTVVAQPDDGMSFFTAYGDNRSGKQLQCAGVDSYEGLSWLSIRKGIVAFWGIPCKAGQWIKGSFHNI
jgi:hypothetical protein